jgi:hypothetical protein
MRLSDADDAKRQAQWSKAHRTYLRQPCGIPSFDILYVLAMMDA